MSDWDYLPSDSAMGSPPLLQGIIPVPQQEDQGAAFMPPSAYATAPTLPDSNAGISQAGGTPSARGVGTALGAAGYFPDGAASFAKMVTRDKATAEALDGIMPYFDVPLAAGSGIANTIADIHQGTSPLDAIVGNIAREGLVYGAGMAGAAWTPELGGAGGIPAARLADHTLPPAPQIGHFAVGILGPLSSFDPAYDPVAF